MIYYRSLFKELLGQKNSCCIRNIMMSVQRTNTPVVVNSGRFDDSSPHEVQMGGGIVTVDPLDEAIINVIPMDETAALLTRVSNRWRRYLPLTYPSISMHVGIRSRAGLWKNQTLLSNRQMRWYLKWSRKLP